jgi:alkylhydroperoxidase/carboxymuconolactone decarboxylase family protein YurZ
MKVPGFTTPHGKKVNIDAFIHLVQISKIDKKISREELELLHREGRKFGLTDPEIEELMHAQKGHYYTPPYSLDEKFEHLYQVAMMILADEVVKESELKMIRKFAIEAGFSDKTIEKLVELLFNGIRNNESEEVLLKEFRKNHLFKD